MVDHLVMNLAHDWKDNTDQPLYRALYGHVRGMILCAQLKAGMRLPASRLLAKALKVSRNTVVEAYSLLQREGFVISQRGAGFFVADDLPKEGLGPAPLFREGRNEDMPDISDRANILLHHHKSRRDVQNAQVFSPGRPALEEFPFDVWARLLSRRWRLSGPRLAMAEDPAGHLALRLQLSAHLKSSRGVNCDAHQILIVSGAQQGLDLIARVLWNKGDNIVLDDPGFPGIDAVVEGAGATLLPVSIDGDGMDVEKAAHVYKDVKSFLVTPSRNYPLGNTMSLARRLSLIELARKRKAWIIEDDYDSDFRFDGNPLSSLQGLDQDGRVIYVGTFSRILFPALRLGFVVLPKPLVSAFLATKAYSDGHTSIVHQAALADFFEEGYYQSHLRRMRKLYKERRAFLLQALDQGFSEELEVFPSDGGLHICVAFKKRRDDVKFAEQLKAEGVIIRPLSRFFRNKEKQSGFLLGFAGYNQEEVRRGLEIIRKVLSR